jgi:anti-sigma regulatory factor (Ser/Thr protein kinase)
MAVADGSAESRRPRAARRPWSVAADPADPAQSERSWCLVVPHHPRGAGMARRRLSAELGRLVTPGLLADVITVVAEFVGNAVRHADPLPGEVLRVAWRLRPGVDGGVVEVRVTDGGAPGRPHLRVVDSDASDGRGLTIVAALADRWGVDRDGLGQSVWAELSAVPAVPAARTTASSGGSATPSVDHGQVGVL